MTCDGSDIGQGDVARKNKVRSAGGAGRSILEAQGRGLASAVSAVRMHPRAVSRHVVM